MTGPSVAMRVPVVFLNVALPFFLSALTHPRRHSARSVGSAVPISRRNEVRSANGRVNVPFLKANTQWSIRYSTCVVARIEGLSSHCLISTILNGFLNFERNTGKVHPLANGLGQSPSSRSYLKRATESVPLVDVDSGDYWYGVIQVGDPPKPFTGES